MDQTEQMDAVFKSTRVDPVSGNEVPPGAMPEEVRDDVPAMLSEGEYVVPADVLRYYGVKFFEDLRDKAKEEMMGMEADGRTGQPIDDDMPFSMEELNVIDDGEEDMPMEGMAKGGYVKGYADGGVVYDPNVANMATPDFLQGVVAPGGSASEEYKTYTNDAGMMMTVRFINGKPTSYIPPGYKEQGAAGTATVTPSAVETVAEQQQTPRYEGGPDPNTPQGMAAQSTATIAGQLQGLQTGTGLAGFMGKAMDNSILGMISKALTGKSLSQNNIESMQAELAARFDTEEGKQAFKDIVSDMEKSGKIDRNNAAFDIAVTGGLDRSFFSSDESFNDAMQAVAPPGMNFNASTGSYTRGDAGGDFQGVGQTVGDVTRGGESLGTPSPSANATATPSAVATARSGINAGLAARGIDSPDGPSGSKVICTALHNKGLLDSKIYELDEAYGQMIRMTNPALMDGYHKMAVPFANYIQKDTLGAVAARYAVAPFARAWANEMAHVMKPEEYKGSILGKAIMAVTYPVCEWVGKKQEQEYAY